MDGSSCEIERLKEYSADDAAGIGRLMPFLNDRFKDTPMPDSLLRTIIESPEFEQIVARINNRIVGAATLSIIMGPGVGREGYLSDFVVDPECRGKGVGEKIWQEMMNWCAEKEVDLAFTSNPMRIAAHQFYKDHGAEIRDTSVFHVNVKR